MRLLTAICLTALVVAFAVPAFAEVQNVKISGDIGIAHIYQKNIDLNNAANLGNQNFFLQQIGLNVGADLTDNVSSYIRIINERELAGQEYTNSLTNAFDVSLDEAYITLKEMLYAPLTLKMGRQNIWLGKGLVIGNAGVGVWDAAAGLPFTVHELSDMTAFDALRATLDYDPWTIDLIYAKIGENNNGVSTKNYDDVDLYVANVGYKFAKYDAEAEAYYILKNDRSNVTTATIRSTDMHTLGLRGSLVPFDNTNVWAEGAYQFGDYNKIRDRKASAFDVGGDYTLADVRWTPKVGLEYTYLSGEEPANSGDYEQWDPLYAGKFDSYIAAFREITKVTGDANDTNGATNHQQLSILGSLNPMADIRLDAKYALLWFSETPVANRDSDIGSEIDAKVTYDYTEDVSFIVAGGLFIPGDYYQAGSNDKATQLISSVKVDF